MGIFFVFNLYNSKFLNKLEFEVLEKIKTTKITKLMYKFNIFY